MSKKLSEIIKLEGLDKMQPITIMYRTWAPDESDILSGYCKYEDGKIISLDGDNYSLNDKFVKHELRTIDGEPMLIVWYESEWI